MRVLVVFEPAFTGDPLEAVWIINSPQNRGWYQQNVTRIDGNSAVFVPDSDPVDILEHVFEHHPKWTEIVVTGMKLTAEIEQGIQPDAVVGSQGADGFRLVRP